MKIVEGFFNWLVKNGYRENVQDNITILKSENEADFFSFCFDERLPNMLICNMYSSKDKMKYSTSFYQLDADSPLIKCCIGIEVLPTDFDYLLFEVNKENLCRDDVTFTVLDTGVLMGEYVFKYVSNNYNIFLEKLKSLQTDISETMNTMRHRHLLGFTEAIKRFFEKNESLSVEIKDETANACTVKIMSSNENILYSLYFNNQRMEGIKLLVAAEKTRKNNLSDEQMAKFMLSYPVYTCFELDDSIFVSRSLPHSVSVDKCIWELLKMRLVATETNNIYGLLMSNHKNHMQEFEAYFQKHIEEYLKQFHL